MRINGNVIGANNRPTSNTANGVWRWDASTMHRLYNQFPTYAAAAAPPSSTQAQGSTSGYTSGGQVSNVIDKFPFASNANATDVGDLTDQRGLAAGQSSTTHGYTSGGNKVANPSSVNIIDKFPFASNANATDVGDLSVGRYQPTGQISSTSGYTSGGYRQTSPFPKVRTTIDKFPFASDANATDVGALTVSRFGNAGQSSTTNGYTSGGYGPSLPGAGLNIIDKFPFASDTNATDVGDITIARYGPAGQSSSTHGYSTTGAGGGVTYRNTIDKFPFATDANATDVGDISIARYTVASQSSTVSGYNSGGYTSNPAGSASNIIDKFPFATDADGTDVGDLTVARYYNHAGQQV